MKYRLLILTGVLFSGFLPGIARAHEAYVLDHGQFWSGLAEPFDLRVFDALKDPHNLVITLTIVGVIIFFLFLNFLFRLTSIGTRAHRAMEYLVPVGPFFVRIAIAASFFFSAHTMSFLGPELPLTELPYAAAIRVALYVISVLIAAGLFTEIAALIGVALFTIGFLHFGMYLFTYLSYLGELIVLLLFGMRSFSVDRLLFGPLSQRLKRWEKYEATIIRIFYGCGLIYAAITVKLLHSTLTETVVTQWNLTQFSWLFPADPLLVVLGAALAEIVIGLFIIFGFELRMTVLISLFYITLSLMYFGELIWPHLMLYGIAFNLLVQPEVFTLDHLLFRHHRQFRRWWHRTFDPHTERGKSARHEALVR